MRIIGVTGGIGAGKSSVSKILKDFGAEIIDADVIAREIVKKGEKALEAIKAYFGDDIVTSDDELDRHKLGQIVFSDKEKLKVLNEITHKYIIDRIKNAVALAEKQGKEAAVIDAAIPFEKGFLDTANEIWVVVAEENIRIERIMKRNGFTREEAVKRINSQMSQEEYKVLADHIILNNGGFDELMSVVKELFFKN